MKKVIKLASLLMALILIVTTMSGCSLFVGGAEDPETVRLSIKIGVPVDENDPEWVDWQDQLEYVAQDVSDYNNIEITWVKIPTEEGKELNAFMKDVKSGDIACFLSERRDFIDDLVEDEALASVMHMSSTYDTILGEAPDVVFDLSQEIDLENYMIPLYSTYQALYYNRGLLKDLKLPSPTNWKDLQTVIAGLKEANITPIAAGFADEGLEYMIDEIVLAEGGTAEHSYMPNNGVMSSWERAAADIRAMEADGVFTKDCYNVNFEDALASFLDGSAGMIVAPSTAFGGAIADANVKGVPFPAPATGKREDMAFIGECKFGMYVSYAYFEKVNERYSAVIADLVGDEYLGGEGIYQIFKNEGTLNMKASYYEYLDPISILEESKKALITPVNEGEIKGDIPMRERAQDMDAIVEGFRTALKGKEADAYNVLLKVSQAETALQDAAEAEKKKDK